ncbi:MAG: hypothetical protein PHZ09_02380 [Eubacteriales bacterium]|nr:hypothetical protein [Eubacteriales bacterium]
MNKSDTDRLRALAYKVREAARNPINDLKRLHWTEHTSMRGGVPPIFVSPEGAWEEILPYAALRCEDPAARVLEYDLLQRIFRAEHIADDVPIEDTVVISKYNLPMSDCWGIRPERVPSPGRGAWRYKPVIEKPSDWKKLRKPVLTLDEAATAARFDVISDAVGDILNVRLTGCVNFSFHLMHIYCDFRGLENMLTDLILEPNMVHEVMCFLTEGYEGLLDSVERSGLISHNNNGTYHYTGGLGYTDSLPGDECNTHVALAGVWGAAEAQELSCVSPVMHEEFALRYERRLLERFGLNGYGCCDDLTDKLCYVKKIKNLRRVGICPWADLEKCADVLGHDYIMTWKPNPSYLAGETFDEAFIENYLTESLRKCRHGYVEIVLRDTHTCRREPQRFYVFYGSS